MVHKSSVAVAVAVLSAASTLAVPAYGLGEGLEAREMPDDNALEARFFFGLFGGNKKKSATPSTSLPSSAAATATATSHASVKPAAGTPLSPSSSSPSVGAALPTITRHLRAQPTPCKSGERASWDLTTHKPLHARSEDLDSLVARGGGKKPITANRAINTPGPAPRPVGPLTGKRAAPKPVSCPQARSEEDLDSLDARGWKKAQTTNRAINTPGPTPRPVGPYTGKKASPKGAACPVQARSEPEEDFDSLVVRGHSKNLKGPDLSINTAVWAKPAASSRPRGPNTGKKAGQKPAHPVVTGRSESEVEELENLVARGYGRKPGSGTRTPVKLTPTPTPKPKPTKGGPGGPVTQGRPSRNSIPRATSHLGTSKTKTKGSIKTAAPARDSKVARSVDSATSSVPGAPVIQHTPAPGQDSPKGEGSGKVIATKTMKGKDGHQTVVHVLPPRRTRCYAEPTAAALSHGSSASRLDLNKGAAQGAAHHNIGKHHEQHRQSLEAKVVARAADFIAEYLNQLD